MATRTGAQTKRDDGFVITTWEGLAGDGDDVGSAMCMGMCDSLCVQAVGTMGNDGSFTVQGSNDGGVSWGSLHDYNGDVIALTVAGQMEVIAERPLAIRAFQTEGEAAVTDVDIIVVGQRRSQ